MTNVRLIKTPSADKSLRQIKDRVFASILVINSVVNLFWLICLLGNDLFGIFVILSYRFSPIDGN